MDETQAIVPYVKPPPLTLDQTINGWLDEKVGRSGSERTLETYTRILSNFRDHLRAFNEDLDSDPAIVALAFQAWAGVSKSDKRDGVSGNTYNLRASAVSSFYLYAMRNDCLQFNPMIRVKRRVGKAEDPARFIPESQVEQYLLNIDRSTIGGLRDYALLSVAFETSRRAAELCGMLLGHLHLEGKTCKVEWPRTKGNKRMEDELPAKTTQALLEYLVALYGFDWQSLPANTPVWISFRGRDRGKQLGYQAVNDLCRKHIGTPKVHATRHSWSHAMYKKNAPLHVIQKGLGHSSLAVTARYLEDTEPYENPYAPALEQSFGIGKRKEQTHEQSIH